MAARNKTGANTIPILLKISPDLEDADLISLLETSTALGINGFIATNTTLARDHGSPFPNDGGVSGYPLASRSKQILRTIVSVLGDSRGDLLIISTGGVLTPKDVVERLKLGANLVQVYTALTYNGPFFFRNVARAIEALTSS
jgi:dihydroorotate dehydrogenase